VTDEVRLSSSRAKRALYSVLGFVFLGIGIAGIFQPLVPTTINIILAAYFFFQSNEKMYKWLMNHPRFGPALRDYRAGLGIPLRAKIWAVVAVALTFTSTILLVIQTLRGRLAMIALALAICAYIVSRPTKEKVLAARAASLRASTS
jgi:uncharacterized membrane protein YbaN (DUF454 family)